MDGGGAAGAASSVVAIIIGIALIIAALRNRDTGMIGKFKANYALYIGIFAIMAGIAGLVAATSQPPSL